MTVAQQLSKTSLPIRLPGEDNESEKVLYNAPAKAVAYFNPEQIPAPGVGLSGPNDSLPKLFTPIQIQGMEIPNRIWVSPMCQYSARDGFQQPWHFAHYGALAQRGVHAFTP